MRFRLFSLVYLKHFLTNIFFVSFLLFLSFITSLFSVISYNCFLIFYFFPSFVLSLYLSFSFVFFFLLSFHTSENIFTVCKIPLFFLKSPFIFSPNNEALYLVIKSNQMMCFWIKGTMKCIHNIIIVCLENKLFLNTSQGILQINSWRHFEICCYWNIKNCEN